MEAKVKEEIERKWEDDFFAGYSAKSTNDVFTFAVQREMVLDKTRTQTYFDAVAMNAPRIRDSIVMDVGSGSGILSMFCAKFGPKKVIAVEGNKEMAKLSEDIIKANEVKGLCTSHEYKCVGITVITGRIGDPNKEEFKGTHKAILDALDGQKVDIMISEWMGHFLIYERMIDTVLLSRDLYLVGSRARVCVSVYV